MRNWMLGHRPIADRIIAPNAIERIGAPTKTLDLDKSIGVMVESGSPFLILGTSTTCSMAINDVADVDSLPTLYDAVQAELKKRGEDRTFYTLINTSRSRTSSEAVSNALRGYKLLREFGKPFQSTLIKLEVFEPATHATVDSEVFKAAQELYSINPAFEIMPFIGKDASLALRLVEQFHCPAIRIFGTTIGEGAGLGEAELLKSVIDAIHPVPVIAEGGLGTAEHVKQAMKLGAAACLVNTAIATHADPVGFTKELREAAGHVPATVSYSNAVDAAS